MRRIIVIAAVIVGATLSLATPASAWPPVCKPVVYDLTGICI